MSPPAARLLGAAAALAVLAPAARAQLEEGKPCTQEGNAGLRGLKRGATLAGLAEGGVEPSAWSTSMLPADGKPPKKRIDPNDPASEVIAKAAENAWSCKYSAANVSDGRPETAWCEGADGAGINEAVAAVLPDGPGAPRIRAGYAKSPKAYVANNRPKRVRVTVLQAKDALAQQAGMVYRDLVVLGAHEVTLRDVNAWQPLPLPPFKSLPEPRGTIVVVEILSVYPGSTAQDTCISEIGREG
jgi:hypothetical protein